MELTNLMDYARPAVNIGRLIFTIAFFAYIGSKDIKTREIPPKAWYPAIIAAIVFIVIDVAFYYVIAIDIGAFRQLFVKNLQIISLNVLVASSIGLGMYYIPRKLNPRWKMFGAADMKAFLVLGILFPKYAVVGPLPVANPPSFLIRPIMSVVEWTAIVSLVYIIALTAYLLSKRKNKEVKLPESILGYEMSPEKLPEHETVRLLHDKNGKLTFDGLSGREIKKYMTWRNEVSGLPNIDSFKNLPEELGLYEFAEYEYGINQELSEEEILEQVEEEEAHMISVSDSETVWVIPELPYLAYVAVGVILTCILGDPIQLVMMLL